MSQPHDIATLPFPPGMFIYAVLLGLVFKCIEWSKPKPPTADEVRERAFGKSAKKKK